MSSRGSDVSLSASCVVISFLRCCRYAKAGHSHYNYIYIPALMCSALYGLAFFPSLHGRVVPNLKVGVTAWTTWVSWRLERRLKACAVYSRAPDYYVYHVRTEYMATYEVVRLEGSNDFLLFHCRILSHPRLSSTSRGAITRC